MNLEHLLPVIDRKAVAAGLIHSALFTYARIVDLTSLTYGQVRNVQPVDTGLSVDQLLEIAAKLKVTS